MAAKPVPEGYHTVTPYIITSDANKLMAFCEKAFGGEVTHKTVEEGRIRHAEMRIGDSMIMLSQATADYPPTIVHLYIYHPECDAMFDRAVAAGGKVHHADEGSGVRRSQRRPRRSRRQLVVDRQAHQGA